MVQGRQLFVWESEEDMDDPDAPLGHENKAALVEQVMQIGPEEQDVSCVVGRVGTQSFGTGRIPKHLVGVEPVVLGAGDEVGGFGAEDVVRDAAGYVSGENRLVERRGLREGAQAARDSDRPRGRKVAVGELEMGERRNDGVQSLVRPRNVKVVGPCGRMASGSNGTATGCLPSERNPSHRLLAAIAHARRAVSWCRGKCGGIERGKDEQDFVVIWVSGMSELHQIGILVVCGVAGMDRRREGRSNVAEGHGDVLEGKEGRLCWENLEKRGTWKEGNLERGEIGKRGTWRKGKEGNGKIVGNWVGGSAQRFGAPRMQARRICDPLFVITLRDPHSSIARLSLFSISFGTRRLRFLRLSFSINDSSISISIEFPSISDRILSRTILPTDRILPTDPTFCPASEISTNSFAQKFSFRCSDTSSPGRFAHSVLIDCLGASLTVDLDCLGASLTVDLDCLSASLTVDARSPLSVASLDSSSSPRRLIRFTRLSSSPRRLGRFARLFEQSSTPHSVASTRLIESSHYTRSVALD